MQLKFDRQNLKWEIFRQILKQFKLNIGENYMQIGGSQANAFGSNIEYLDTWQERKLLGKFAWNSMMNLKLKFVNLIEWRFLGKTKNYVPIHSNVSRSTNSKLFNIIEYFQQHSIFRTKSPTS